MVHLPPAAAVVQQSARGAGRRDTRSGIERESVTSCPACGGTRRILLYSGLRDRLFGCADGEWTLYYCVDCCAAHADPRPTRETIGQAYSSYYTHEPPQPEPAPTGLVRRARVLLRNGYMNTALGYQMRPSADRLGSALGRLVPVARAGAERYLRSLPAQPGGKLLGVGCGNGGFLARMRTLGWQVAGVDPDPRAAAAAHAAGLDVRVGEMTGDTFPEATFDAATMSHVIEHAHDPGELLRATWRALRPGGVLWIATPNLASAGHRAFGRDWLHLDPPRHLVLFTRSALAGLLERAGFELLPDPPLPRQAGGTFAASERLTRGTPPLGMEKVPMATRLRAALADLALAVRPESGEELVMLARRPA